MTPRSFWTILIKLLGIYIILQSLIAIPQFLAYLYIFTTQANTSGSNTFLFIEGAYYITVPIVFLTILGLCIFKTDWIIDKLQLDKGYTDERFEFNIHRSTILKIVVMVIGGLLIADSFPLFCQQLLAYFQQSNTLVYKKFTDSPISKYIVFYLLKTFIGFFMLTCSRMIVNYIELKRKKADLETAV